MGWLQRMSMVHRPFSADPPLEVPATPPEVLPPDDTPLAAVPPELLLPEVLPAEVAPLEAAPPDVPPDVVLLEAVLPEVVTCEVLPPRVVVVPSVCARNAPVPAVEKAPVLDVCVLRPVPMPVSFESADDVPLSSADPQAVVASSSHPMHFSNILGRLLELKVEASKVAHFRPILCRIGAAQPTRACICPIPDT